MTFQLLTIAYSNAALNRYVFSFNLKELSSFSSFAVVWRFVPDMGDIYIESCFSMDEVYHIWFQNMGISNQ